MKTKLKGRIPTERVGVMKCLRLRQKMIEIMTSYPTYRTIQIAKQYHFL